MEHRKRRGLWKPEEDLMLKNYVETHGEGNWATVSQKSGLMRGGKSCRLRWKNYLRPNIKRGSMSQEEEDLIIRMHKLIGNRWSLIAGRLPGRTDNEVKNYWNTHLSKKPPKRKATGAADPRTNKKLRTEEQNTVDQQTETKTRTWLEEYLPPVDNTTFVFDDDDPFFTHYDFMLHEAFEFATQGLHSIMHVPTTTI